LDSGNAILTFLIVIRPIGIQGSSHRIVTHQHSRQGINTDMREETVEFINRNGKRIYGIVHLPDKKKRTNRKMAINILNPGIKYRVAPNRLNVKIARRLCSSGYSVFRFDPEGIGDSEGGFPDDLLVPDIFEMIQTGCFVSDIIESNDLIEKAFGIEQIALVGNCGGAITSILAAQSDDRVKKLCLIDTPVNLRTTNISFADKTLGGGERANQFFSGYIRKLFQLDAWYRFISLKTDYRSLCKIMLLRIKKWAPRMSQDENMSQEIEKLCNEGKLNRLFFKAFDRAIQKSICMLFIVAEKDPGSEFFNYYFRDSYLREEDRCTPSEKMVKICQIDNANHVYTLQKWQESLIDKIDMWLNECE
jgi:uncharacterized protein